jgi:hypothetical protein
MTIIRPIEVEANSAVQESKAPETDEHLMVGVRLKRDHRKLESPAPRNPPEYQ